MTISRLSGDSWAANTVFIAAIEFSGGDFAPSGNTAGIKAADMANHQIGASHLRRAADMSTFLNRWCHRLFQQHMLTRLQGGDGYLGPAAPAGCDMHQIDGGIGKDIAIVRI